MGIRHYGHRNGSFDNSGSGQRGSKCTLGAEVLDHGHHLDPSRSLGGRGDLRMTREHGRSITALKPSLGEAREFPGHWQRTKEPGRSRGIAGRLGISLVDTISWEVRQDLHFAVRLPLGSDRYATSRGIRVWLDVRLFVWGRVRLNAHFFTRVWVWQNTHHIVRRGS